MDLTYKQEVSVGALVLAGLVLFVVLLFWFSGKSLSHSGVYAHVAFANVAGLKEGDPVMVSGVKKGRVAKVALERVGHVLITLELSSDVRERLLNIWYVGTGCEPDMNAQRPRFVLDEHTADATERAGEHSCGAGDRRRERLRQRVHTYAARRIDELDPMVTDRPAFGDVDETSAVECRPSGHEREMDVT